MYLLLLLTALVCVSHCRSICVAQVAGVDDTWKQVIVKKHNELRAKIANGREGNLTKAANMLEMVWDDVLAEKAQEWANKCEFKHDTQKDRDTGQGYTGQNIAYRSNKQINPDWEQVVQNLYDEVVDFDSKAVDKYFFQYEVSHFTEIVWAKTYKVGCGYVRLQEGKLYRHLYGCDYLPGGNILNRPIYERGEPCSNCGRCGSTPGLCDTTFNYVGEVNKTVKNNGENQAKKKNISGKGSTLFNFTKLMKDDGIIKDEKENNKNAKNIEKSVIEKNITSINLTKIHNEKLFKGFNTLTLPEFVMNKDGMKTTE